MNNIYYFIFYYSMQVAKKIGHKTDFQWVGMSILCGLEGLSALMFLTSFSKYHFWKVYPKFYGMIVMLTIILVNYMVLIRNNKYEKITSFFEKKIEKKKRIYVTNVFTLLFAVLYIGIIILSGKL